MRIIGILGGVGSGKSTVAGLFAELGVPIRAVSVSRPSLDDVFLAYTGRTIRAGLDEIVDFGRPRLIRLLVVVDRGLREYPIQPDYVARRIETDYSQVVQVRLTEVDGEDRVVLCRLPAGQ